MPIRVQCSGCKTALAVKDHLAGKRVKCPKCQTPINVPAPSASTSAATLASAPLPVKPAPKSVAKASLKPKAPVAQPADMEAEAAAALREELGAPPATNGTNGTNGHGANGTANGNGHAVDTPPPPLKFACEYCEAEIEMPAELAGKKAPCPECRRIIKVPVPKEDPKKAPTDWRKVEKKGPSLAAINQPEKIENAWGTEKKAQVSQSALLQAGVIEKPKAPSLGMAGWIERGIKYTLLALLVGGVGLGVWKLRSSAKERERLNEIANTANEKWPAVIKGEFSIGLADLALRQPKQRETARVHFISAWQHVDKVTDPADKIDCEVFLIRLAKAQLKLGGEEMDIREQSRFDWNREVFEEVLRTVKKIDTPEARVCALRQLVPAFTEKKQPDLAIGLVNKVAEVTPQAKAFQLALLVEAGKQKEAERIAKEPEPNRAVDAIARSGYAEGYARKGDTDKALKIAEMKGDVGQRVQALVAVACSLSIKGDKAGAKTACDKARTLLEQNGKANVPPWTLLQQLRITASSGDESAKADARVIAKRLPAAYQRRAQLELVLVALEDPNASPALLDELDKDGPSRALAWLAIAQAKKQANLPFQFTPDTSEDEILRPFFRAVDAIAQTKPQ